MPELSHPTVAQHFADLLDLSSTAVVRRRGANPPLADPAEDLRAALAAPLDFPALADATAPGDRAAIAVAAGVPQAERLALGAVRGLLDAGVEPEWISIVSERPLAKLDELRAALAKVSAAGVHSEVHDPKAETNCAMVGITEAGLPLRINRTLVEADVVLPIGGARLSPDGAPSGAKFDSLLPGFSDAETQRRFRRQWLKNSEFNGAVKSNVKLTKEIDEAGWLLGALMTIQVTPGPDDSVIRVFAGEAGAIARAAGEFAADQWLVHDDQSGDLVVAVVGKTTNDDGWHNVGRALLAAEAFVNPDGAVAICTDLSEPPNGALRRLIDADDLARAESKLLSEDKPNGWPALQLARALQRGPVYLRSRLRTSNVESLGITPIANDEELARLVEARANCILIDQAHLLVPARN